MKKMFAGIMIMVLIAMKAIPVFGEAVRTLDENILKEVEIVEETIVESVYSEDGTLEKCVKLYEYSDGSTMRITYGNNQVCTIIEVTRPGIIRSIGNGFCWLGQRFRDGFEHVKGWFTNDD